MLRMATTSDVIKEMEKLSLALIAPDGDGWKMSRGKRPWLKATSGQSGAVVSSVAALAGAFVHVDAQVATLLGASLSVLVVNVLYVLA